MLVSICANTVQSTAFDNSVHTINDCQFKAMANDA